MSKLLRADLSVLFRSKLFYGMILLCIFLPAVTNLEAYLSEPGAPLLAPSVTLTMFLCLFVGNFIGGLALVLISAEFTSGEIRNKLIMGHKRSDIFASWFIVYSLEMLIAIIVFFGVFLLSGIIIGYDMSVCDFGEILMNMLVITVMFFGNSLALSILITIILPDTKAFIIFYVLYEALAVPGILLYEMYPDSIIVKIINRCFALSYLSLEDRALIVGFDETWFTIACSLAFGVVIMTIAKLLFDRKDLK